MESWVWETGEGGEALWTFHNNEGYYQKDSHLNGPKKPVEAYMRRLLKVQATIRPSGEVRRSIMSCSQTTREGRNDIVSSKWSWPTMGPMWPSPRYLMGSIYVELNASCANGTQFSLTGKKKKHARVFLLGEGKVALLLTVLHVDFFMSNQMY